MAYGKESPFGIAEGIGASEPGLDEVVLCLEGVGDRGELDIGSPSVGRFVVDPVPEIH